MSKAFHPGEYLRDELKARKIYPAHFAEISHIDPNLLLAILRGKAGIDKQTARLLAEALGTSDELWLNLDAAFEASKMERG